MDSETFGEVLARLRAERNLSLRQLAKRVPYTHVFLWELEHGRKRPSVETAAWLDRALDGDGELAAMLAPGRQVVAPSGVDVGLAYAETWAEGVNAVVRLWRHDAGRRRMLAGAAFSATAAAVPVMRWLTADPDMPAGDGARAVGAADVDTIREMTATWRRLDNRFGGGHARTALVRFLDGEVAPLLRDGRYDAATGRALAGAAAELTQLAGWTAYDAGQNGLAQRYFIQALRLAQAAGDTALAAEVLAAMSHQAVYLGQAATGVDLARTARAAATKAGVPALVAEAQVMQAHGHAAAGDERACTEALTAAERTLDAADRSTDPAYLGYFGAAYLSAKFGHCFAALGQAGPARRFAERSLDMDGSYVRGRAFNLALLARAHTLGPKPDPERAAAVGTEALGLAGQLRSARAVGYLQDLGRRLRPYAALPSVAAFTAGVGQLQPAGGAGQ